MRREGQDIRWSECEERTLGFSVYAQTGIWGEGGGGVIELNKAIDLLATYYIYDEDRRGGRGKQGILTRMTV